ncbi:MAG: zf-HC2 domain-containing protein [Planctomycetota bacterium]|jgi:hypothetical protein
MISDELRELISAYVDGELPHGEAARVEESAKRDPRIRRHVNSYRRLAETLRIWDVEEHAHRPSERLKERALARVKAYESERRHEVGPIPLVWWQKPAAMAAGVLIALALGVLAAIPRSTAEATAQLARTEAIEQSPVKIGGDFRASMEMPALKPVEIETERWPVDTFTSVVRFDTVGLPLQVGEEILYFPNRRTLEAFDYIRNVDKDFKRSPDRPRIKETRTGTQPNAFLASVLKEYGVHTTGFEGLVALRRKAAAAKLPPMRPAPVRTDDNSRFAEAGPVGAGHYMRVTNQQVPVLSLAGEIWVEPQGDEVGFSRVVTATTWVKSGELVRMAWATPREIDPKANQFALRAESLVLGPKARRMLLGRSGRDAELLERLNELYGKRDVIAAGRAGAKANRAAIGKLVAALDADHEATGFAVHGEDGRLLGTEIFATHELMVQFAPRLLRGYFLEAGGRVKLKKANGGAQRMQAHVRAFLAHELPRNAQRVVDVRTWKDAEDWPEGMRQVNLVSPTRRIIGHGLFLGETPVHLTLFGG